MSDKAEGPAPTKPPFFDRRSTQLGISMLVVVVVMALLGSIKFQPNLDHLDVSMLSGSSTGNYHAVVHEISARATQMRGAVANVESKGSLDNVAKLQEANESCDHVFALSQNGVSFGDARNIEVVAHLSSAEVVFFLGLEADKVTRLADLKGKRIGVGPRGSGTAQVAEQILHSRGFDSLGIEISHQPIGEQLAMLERGELDLGVFVIHPDSTFILGALLKRGMQIVSFPQAGGLAHWIPALRPGVMDAGRYDPVKMVPPTDKIVFEVDTLVIANECAGRSDVVGLLVLLNDVFPGLVEHNLAASQTSRHTMHDAAAEFFQNRGPSLLDDHVPWLANYVPGSGLVQISLFISVLFNLLGFGNRFRLWRIDARRIELEEQIAEILGAGVRIPKLVELELTDRHREPATIRKLELLMDRFESLKATSYAQSQEAILGPDMGKEIGYRFQESLIDESVDRLRAFIARLA